MRLCRRGQRPYDAAMHELARHVRFCVNPAEPSPYQADTTDMPARHNSFAAWPSMTGIGTYYELIVVCRGAPDTKTGYVMNAMDIDAIARSRALPIIDDAVRTSPHMLPGLVLRDCATAMRSSSVGSRLERITWRLTPFYSVTIEVNDMDHVFCAQQFEFAAAHRLNCDDLSAEENQRIFGKCSNASGHGHNYRLEASVRVPIEQTGSGLPFTLRDLERLVNETVIERFDHKNLNTDLDEFQDRNPSVENIAHVIYEILATPVEARGASLHRVTVWETDKTWCAYPA